MVLRDMLKQSGSCTAGDGVCDIKDGLVREENIWVKKQMGLEDAMGVVRR